MKTLILDQEIQKSLSPEILKQIEEAQENRNIKISEIKDKIKSLTYRYVAVRSDTNIVEVNEKPFLKLCKWFKTDGEQWGNCDETNMTIKIGTKYISVIIERQRTNGNYYSKRKDTISINTFDNILNLLIDAEKEEEENNPDADVLRRKAVNQCYQAIDLEY